MKLATLRDGTRDGHLMVVRRDNLVMASARDVAPNLQAALDDWENAAPKLQKIQDDLESGALTGEPVDTTKLGPPLPRAYEWIDGSAYLNHVILVRKARNAEPPATLRTDPLVYQGGSGVLLGPNDDIVIHDTSWGLDFEAELCVILGDTPLGTTADAASGSIRLFMIANDVSLRGLIPTELRKNFGFFNSKPATAFSPFAVTPDELGDALSDGRVNLKMRSVYNGDEVGDVQAGPEMHFSFHDLIAHITRTRAFTAGTILGSGTISNAGRKAGISCLAEQRMIEIIDTGSASTPFMTPGDTITIEMHSKDGHNIFGSITQKVIAPEDAGTT